MRCRPAAFATRLLTLAVVLFGALPTFAYVLVMKDGSKVLAKDKYEVKGGFAVFHLPNGTINEIPMAKLDVAATEKYNKENVSSAITWDSPGEIPTPPSSAPKRDSLTSYIEKHGTRPDLPAPKAKAQAEVVPKSDSGDPMVIREAARIFSADNISQYRVAPGPKVILVADDENTVFHQMTAAAKLTIVLTASGRAKDLEVEIVSASGSPGGRFKMDADNAKALAEGEVTPSEYFVTNVIF
jgi:hypothetical protein